MTVWGKKSSLFVLQKQKETFQQDEIPITFPSSNLTTKPSELPSTPANTHNKVPTKLLKAETEKKHQQYDTRYQETKKQTFNTYIQEMNQNCEDKLDVVMLLLKQLDLLDVLSFLRKTNKGRSEAYIFSYQKKNMEILAIKLHIFNNNIRAEKLRVSDKKYIQAGLDFIDIVTIISQRNKIFYESNCKNVYLYNHNPTL